MTKSIENILEKAADYAFSESLWDCWLQPELTKIKVNPRYNYEVIYNYVRDKFNSNKTYNSLNKTVTLYQNLLDIENGVATLKGAINER